MKQNVLSRAILKTAFIAAGIFVFSPASAFACGAYPAGMNTNDAVLGLSADGSNLVAYTSLTNAGTSREGMLIYDRTLNTVSYCDGTSWKTLLANGVVGTAAGTVTGAVQFRNGSGVFAADDTNFIWDDTNNRLGIGTAGPNAQLEVGGLSLGSTATNSVLMGRFGYTNTNASKLDVIGFRTTGGTDWTTASTRLQQVIDATYMGYIQFNGTGNQYGLSFGTGGSTGGYNDAAEVMRMTSAGNVGIGTTAPSSPLHVYRTSTAISGALYGAFLDNLYDPTADSAGGARGMYARARTNATVTDNFSSTSALIGGHLNADHLGTGTLGGMYGGYFGADISGAVAGAVTNQYGSYSYASITSGAAANVNNQIGSYAHTTVGTATTGTIPNSRAFYGLITPGSSGAVITTGTGLEVGINGASSFMTNWRGIYIQDDNRGGAGDYAIFSDDASTKSRFDGPLGLGGDPNAAAKLDVISTTQGFLPPRMTTAQVTAIVSPTDGLMAYDTTTDTIKLYANGAWVSLQNTGSAGSAAGTVTGAVQFRGSTGVLAADDTNFVWDDTNNRLGIGMATPANRLDVQTTTGPSTDSVRVISGSNASIWMAPHVGAGSWNGLSQLGDQGIFFSGTAGQGTGNLVIAPWAAGTSGIRITGSGLVGIGDPTPSTELEVTGTIKSSGPLWSSFGNTGTHRGLILENYDNTANTHGVDVAAKLGSIEFQGLSWVKESAWTTASAGTAKDVMLQFGVMRDGAAAVPMVIKSDTKVGIGTTSPSYQLDNIKTDTSLTPNRDYVARTLLTLAPTATNTGNNSAAVTSVTTSGAQNFSGDILTHYNLISHAGTGILSTGYAAFNGVYGNNTGDITTAYGSFNTTASSNAGTTITNAYGMFGDANNNAGIITNGYGVHGRTLRSSTNNMTTAIGTYGQTYNNNATGTISSAFGAYNDLHNLLGTTTTGYGTYSRIYHAAPTTMATGYGVYGQILTNNASAVITNAIAVQADLANTAGTVSNYYGVKVEDEGTANPNYYSIYTGTTKSYFAGQVGVGATAPDASAKLDVSSTTQGLLPPRMTTAQVTAIATPADGLIVYDTTTDTIKLRANGAWASLSTSAGITALTGDVTATGPGSAVATIAANAIGSAEITDGSVTSADITDGTIASADIADGTIASADIADGTVASADITDSTIVSADIAADTIAAVDIATGGVATAEILDGTITNTDLASGVAVANLGYTPVNKAGDAMTGNLGIGGGAATSTLAVGGAGAGTWKVYIQGAGTTSGTYGLVLRESTGATNNFWVRDDGAIYVRGTSALTGAVTASSTLAVTGAVTASSTLAVTGAVTASSTVAATGLITASGGVSMGGTLALGAQAVTSSAGTVIDANGGWVRTYGNTGWYNGTHGGGWNMTDTTWLRAYGSKSVYTTGTMRADAGFDVGGTTRINSAGNFITPTFTSDYVCQSSSSGVINCSSGAGGYKAALSSSRGDGHVCYTTSSKVMTYTTNASGCLTGSDITLKKNVKSMTAALDSLVKLRPVTFEWRDAKRGEGVNFGFIAQEVHDVLPELTVAPDKDFNFWRLDTDALVPYLVQGLKDLNAKVEAQDTQLKAQGAAIEELRREIAEIKAARP